MTGDVQAPVLTARRAPQHIRLFCVDDAYRHLCVLAIPPSLAPSPRYARSCTASSRLRCHSLRVWVHCPRASDGLLSPRPYLVGYAQWDARSDQFLLVRQSLQQLFRSQCTIRTWSRRTLRLMACQLMAYHSAASHETAPTACAVVICVAS